MTTYKTILDIIGNTPLIKLDYFSQLTGATILGKCEFMNPCASVKDRTALALIEAAEKAGKLKKGSTIVEATSGNTGIGLAFVGARKGYDVILTMPESMTLERRKMLMALGAKIVLTPAHLGMSGALSKAAELANKLDQAFIPNQFDNQANPQVHYETTGPEIFKDTQGSVDIVVAGVGTGGTIAGMSRYFREQEATTQIVAVEPTDSAVLSGNPPGPHMIQGIGAGFIPANITTEDYDQLIQVSNEEAFKTTRQLAQKEGVLCGMSSGANVFAAVKCAQASYNKGKTIVCILCDFGERYLSTTLFEQEEINEYQVKR